MNITSDWHLHSEHSHDAASMPICDFADELGKKGVRGYGVTDHFHTPYNLPDIVASRKAFLACSPPAHFHFGIEVSCVSQWEIDEIATGRHEAPAYGLRSEMPPADSPTTIAITAEDIATYGIEYILGASHWPIHAPLDVQAQIAEHHSQNMFLACHPMVDIVAHPWYWSGFWRAKGHGVETPWFGKFQKLPRTMHQEFAAAAVQHGTAVEINLRSIILREFNLPDYKRQYLEYLAFLQSERVQLFVGSDCHSATYDIDLERACAMLDSVGIAGPFWELPPRAEEEPMP